MRIDVVTALDELARHISECRSGPGNSAVRRFYAPVNGICAFVKSKRRSPSG
jgi:hypothetical protein